MQIELQSPNNPINSITLMGQICRLLLEMNEVWVLGPNFHRAEESHPAV